MKDNQVEAIRRHLLRGKSITSYEAFTMYGITRLARIIHALRKSKLNIKTMPIKIRNRYNKEVIFAKYFILR